MLSNLLFEALPSTPPAAVSEPPKSFFNNILRVDPFFAIFYEDFRRIPRANSSVLKDLEIQSGLFFNPDQCRFL
jgi:hypothetical protein